MIARGGRNFYETRTGPARSGSPSELESRIRVSNDTAFDRRSEEREERERERERIIEQAEGTPRIIRDESLAKFERDRTRRGRRRGPRTYFPSDWIRMHRDSCVQPGAYGVRRGGG